MFLLLNIHIKTGSANSFSCRGNFIRQAHAESSGLVISPTGGGATLETVRSHGGDDDGGGAGVAVATSD